MIMSSPLSTSRVILQVSRLADMAILRSRFSQGGSVIPQGVIGLVHLLGLKSIQSPSEQGSWLALGC